MFEKSHTWGRFQPDGARKLNVHLGYVPYLEPDPPEERRAWGLAVAVAVLAHLVLFAVHLPEGRAKPLEISQRPEAYVVRPVRFKPPPPAARELPKPKEKRRIIPIPDPTPDEPEPIREAEVEVPEAIDFSAVGDVHGIPEAPPWPGVGRPAARRIDGSILPPEKVYYPSPRYTEDGRRERVQGVVILEAVIDEEGDVYDVRVLKGLPLGLTESAVETARQWKFRPATQNGRPVPVFLNLTIRFSLQ